MAITKIAHNPGLTSEQAMEAFKQHFEGKYKVEPWVRSGLAVAAPRRDFVIKKSTFSAVSVKLDQGESDTKFVYTGYVPTAFARVLVGGLIALLLQNSLTGEVREFIESAPEFK